MSRMKVELVKVKIDKLKEVKRQLRKKKCSTKKNLKKLLLDEKKKREDDIFYKSINDLFQDEKINNEIIHPSFYPDSTISDYHVDFEDLLESLGPCENDLPQKEPSESLLLKEPNINTEESREECINLTVNDPMNSLCYLVNNDNRNSECKVGDLCLYDDIDTESIVFCGGNKENMDSNLDLNSKELEPAMIELGNYYIPDSVFETTSETTIEIDDICNEIDISLPEDPNTENIDEQVEHCETGDPVVPNLNIQFAETSNHSENEVIPNAVRGVAIINPLLVSIPAADLQTMALYQLQQKNDSQEINNLGETEILKNYSWEQKANIIAAAKLLYTKRTRTLLHWLDPKLSIQKMRATLELSWQNLPLWQKEVYITQIMGPLVVETASPMLNPQLKSGDFGISKPVFPMKRKKERKRFADLLINP